MRFIWTTDIHWDRVDDSGRLEFFADVAELQEEQPAAGLVISGDIGEAPWLLEYLAQIQTTSRLPLYFVLGNHDFYHSDFATVRSRVRAFVQRQPQIFWLSELEPITLAPGIALVGHEGWGDARLGDPQNISQWPQDFLLIQNLKTLSAAARLEKLQSLGDEAAAALRPKLLAAVQDHQQVYCLTHVPPFRETCLDGIGRVDEEGLPFYTCHAVGQVLLEVCSQHPQHRFTVLCGHTHEHCDVKIRENLRVRVKAAGYGRTFTPTIIDVS